VLFPRKKSNQDGWRCSNWLFREKSSRQVGPDFALDSFCAADWAMARSSEAPRVIPRFVMYELFLRVTRTRNFLLLRLEETHVPEPDIQLGGHEFVRLL